MLFLVLANVLILWPGTNQQYSFQLGDTSRETVRAPRSVIFSSESKTSEQAEQAAQDVDVVYKLDQAAYSRQEGVVTETFTQANTILDSSESDTEKKEKLSALFDTPVSNSFFIGITSLSESERAQIEAAASETVLEIHKTELITEDNIEDIKQSIASKSTSELSSDQIELANEAAGKLLITNSVIDQEETDARKAEITQSIEPVFYQVRQDEVILARGEVVDEIALEKLSAVGLSSPGFILNERIGTVMLISILALLLFIYLYKTEKNSRKVAASIGTIIVSTVGLILVSRYFLDANPVLVYVVPVAAVSIAIGMVSKLRLGLFTGLFLTIIISFTFGNLFDVLVIHGVMTVVGLLVFHGIERFRSLAKPIAMLTVVHYALLLAFHFLSGSVTLFKGGQLLLVSLAFSLSTVIIVVGMLILIGTVFNVSTFPVLLDLANPTSPLLKELSVKAPGTYHHSLIVSSLVERATREVGGDVLLAKVASYYHDIGKLNNPGFYIENRKEIPTDKDVTDPVREASKVLSHVDYGVTLAQKHKLPEEIIDVIKEHHGTTLVLYFYNLSDKKSKEEFTYKGPKPQTRESAIIMLADGVEAYVRSYHESPDFDVSKAVSKIFSDRLKEGQLDQSGLSLSELSQVKRAFVEILKSVYHARMSYE